MLVINMAKVGIIDGGLQSYCLCVLIVTLLVMIIYFLGYHMYKKLYVKY